MHARTLAPDTPTLSPLICSSLSHVYAIINKFRVKSNRILYNFTQISGALTPIESKRKEYYPIRLVSQAQK